MFENILLFVLLQLSSPTQRAPVTMSQTVEFIFFQLKASVKPEDPANDEGSGLLNILQTTKQQSGYHSSAWGRTVEDENVVAWTIGTYLSTLSPRLHPPTSNPSQEKNEKLTRKEHNSLDRRTWRQHVPTTHPLHRTRNGSDNAVHHPGALRHGDGHSVQEPSH